jgi:predicted phage terminase large subunit-like protein
MVEEAYRRKLKIPIAPANVPAFPVWLRQRWPAWGWDWLYQQELDRHLDMVTCGEIDRLMISMPPRHGKSEKVTIRYPVYRMLKRPGFRSCVGAYNQDFSERFSRFSRRIIEAETPLSKERSAVKEWETASGCIYRACGVGSPPTGEGFDLMIIDDPIKSREEAESEAYRDRCYNWYKDDLYTRLEPSAAIIIIQTRWHEDDLTGRILASDEGPQWTVLNLPALAFDGEPDLFDRKPGQALCPERYDEEALARIKVTLGSYSFGALYQGRPVAAEGNLFKREWWRHWKRDSLPEFDMIVQSWDCTFEKTDGTDYVVGGVWGHADKRKYLLHLYRARADYVQTREMIRAALVEWPETSFCYIEKAANGHAILSDLREEFQGKMIGVDPKSGKLARAFSVSPMIEAGMVFLPEPYLAPWVEAYLDELSGFPQATHDDQVDMTSQALLILRKYDHEEREAGPAKGDERLISDMPGYKKRFPQVAKVRSTWQ